MNDNFEDFAGFLHCFFLKRNWQNLFIFFVKLNSFLESMAVYIDQIDFESKNIKNEIHFFSVQINTVYPGFFSKFAKLKKNNKYDFLFPQVNFCDLKCFLQKNNTRYNIFRMYILRCKSDRVKSEKQIIAKISGHMVFINISVVVRYMQCFIFFEQSTAANSTC